MFHAPILPIDGSPATNRTDLMRLLLKYPNQPLNGTNCGHPCAELLRLDLKVAPTAPEKQSRLGSVLGGDLAGFPNGRRPNDDVTDIVVRVVGGTNYINAHIGACASFQCADRAKLTRWRTPSCSWLRMSHPTSQVRRSTSTAVFSPYKPAAEWRRCS